MSKLTEKTTIYLNPYVKKFIQHKAIADDASISQIINDYFADMAEDLDDVRVIAKRRKEEAMSFEDVLSELGLDYADLQARSR